MIFTAIQRGTSKTVPSTVGSSILTRIGKLWAAEIFANLSGRMSSEVWYRYSLRVVRGSTSSPQVLSQLNISNTLDLLVQSPPLALPMYQHCPGEEILRLHSHHTVLFLGLSSLV